MMVGWLVSWLAFFFLYFFPSSLLLLAFMSESLYKAALLNLTSKFRFLIKKCALQCRVTSGTFDNTLDCTLPRLQRASGIQFSHTGLCSFPGPLCVLFELLFWSWEILAVSLRYAVVWKALLIPAVRGWPPACWDLPATTSFFQPFPECFLSALWLVSGTSLATLSGINSWSPSGKKLKMLKYEFWCPGC